MSFEIGDIIDSYRLIAGCGHGAYGEVFLAENIVSHRRYALKIVPLGGRDRERELKGLIDYQAICRHTDLLQIYHVGMIGDRLYYTMDAADDLSDGGEYVPDTLANRLRASGRLPAEAVRRMADDLIGCLEMLHGRGVMHRDVKPDNILWVDGTAKPGDVGLVTEGGATLPAGTPGFMPPEVLAGKRGCEPRDDFYALGKVIYCALTGNPVEEYPSFPDSRTLGDCGDLILLYNRLCGGETEFPRSAPKVRRRWWWMAAALTLLLAAAIGFALMSARPAKSGIAVTKRPAAAPAAVPAAPPTAASASFSGSIRERRRGEMEQLAGKYALSSRFEEIRPLVMRDYENLCFTRRRAGDPKYAPPVSRDPPIRLGSDYEDAMRVAAFDRLHENDPVWLFGKLSEAVDADIRAIGNMPDESLADDDFFGIVSDKFEKRLAERKKLEPLLLKKYRPAASGSGGAVK